MPPKRKRSDVGADNEREKFRQRGDMGIYQSGKEWNLALTVEGDGGKQLFLHSALLVSRIGYFNELLKDRKEDESGKIAYTMKHPRMDSLRLVLEFAYGNGMLEKMEYPTKNQPFIQDCVLLFNLGHLFDIPNMVRYAIKHLGNYLSRKLKEICVQPLPQQPQESAFPKEFVEDLAAGINDAVQAVPGKMPCAKNNHPRLMLLDFVVVGQDVLLRDPELRWKIADDSLPKDFINDLLLGLFSGTYKTPWMQKLEVRPENLDQNVKNREHCISCHERCSQGRQTVFNPFSHRGPDRKYTQLAHTCCMEGKSWDVFDEVKEE